MADHAKPILTDNYTDVLSQIRGRFEDQAKGFDPANTTATNISTGTIRWTSASNKWQKWSGTAWADLSSLYAINISGNATTATNASTVTNGVYTVGDQTIAGVKTFSSTIQGSISGNAGTVTNGVYTAGDQTINGVKTFNSNTIFNGNVGIGVSPNTGFITGNRLDILSPSLGTTAGNISAPLLLRADDGNITTLQTFNYRVSNGSDHTTAEYRTQRIVDVTRQAYVGWGSDYLAFGTGNTERTRITSSGNLLVGNTNGTSRITASGVIESTTGGFKFPDGTTQTTAAVSPSTSNVLAATAGASVGEVGTYAMLINRSASSFDIGDTTSGTNLWFSNADGSWTGDFSVYGPYGTWMCMGMCRSNQAGNTAASRVTTWLRIS